MRLDVLEDGAAYARHVRALGYVVALVADEARGPDKHIVAEVAGDVVTVLDVGHQDLAEQGDVLMIPIYTCIFIVCIISTLTCMYILVLA